MYYRTIDGVLLKCLGEEEAKILVGEIHEGVCGAHQLAFKMEWMIRNNNYYWQTILEGCFKYYKGCLSEVWKHSKGFSISNEPNNQTMVIQRLGN
jgi:hypothetical protein